MCHLSHFQLLRLRHLHLRYLCLWYFEQPVHELRRSAVHLDVEILYLAHEVVVGDEVWDRDEDAQRRRDKGLSDTARYHRHAAGSRSRDALESVDDSDYGAEEAD